MDYKDALKVVREYHNPTDHGRNPRFPYTEALGYLIEKTKKPEYMMELARYYCSERRPDLENKYLEQAAEYGYGQAEHESGQTGHEESGRKR